MVHSIFFIFLSSYPDLQFNPLVIPVDSLHLKVDANCADKGRREGVVGVAEQEGGFSNAAVADDEDLEHIIKVLVRGLLLPVGCCC